MSAHGHSSFKHALHAYLIFHSFVVLPIVFTVSIYSFGAMCLLGRWKFCLWMFGILAICVLAEGIIAIFAE